MLRKRIQLMIFLVSALVVLGSQASENPHQYVETVTTEWGDEISFDMVLVPASTFLMGSPDDEEGRDEDEGPQFEVQLAPYYMATKEITLELFLAYYRETHAPADDYFPMESEEVDTITGPTPVYGDMTMGRGIQHPAIGMTWKNAGTFCKWLSAKTGREYRLPTEAEWENACRCGSSRVFGIADDTDQLVDYARFQAGPTAGTREVGTGQPNPFGLFNLQGNVGEWVHDFYSPEGYREAAKVNPVQNPQGPESKSYLFWKR